MDDPSYVLLKAFLLMNEKKRSFSWGDVAIPDPSGNILQQMSTRGFTMYGVLECVLRTPIQRQCNCHACKDDMRTKTAVRAWHSTKLYRGEPVLMLRLIEHSTLTVSGAMECLNSLVAGSTIRKAGCPSRYSDEVYTSASRMVDEVLFSEPDVAQALAMYNNEARVGNEFFMCAQVKEAWLR